MAEAPDYDISVQRLPFLMIFDEDYPDIIRSRYGLGQDVARQVGLE